MKYKVQDSDEIVDGEILEKISQDEYRIKIKDSEHILKILNINSGVMEFVLDNQAAQSFLQAAMILKGQDLSGPKLADLQRESVATMTTGGGSNVVVSAPTTTQISSSSAMALPMMPIQPSNGETALNG